MKIIVAGEKKEFDDGITVSKLIELENVETPQYVTVSVIGSWVMWLMRVVCHSSPSERMIGRNKSITTSCNETSIG